MKIPSFLAATLLVAAVIQAAPKAGELPALPKEKEGRWGVYSFEDAQKEALKKKQPIAFIATSETPLQDASVEEAVKRVFWGLEKYASMVVLPSNTAGTWTTRLPSPAASALTSAALGKEFPKVVVIDQKGEVVLGTLTGAQSIDSDEKFMKDFGRRMDESNKKPPAPGTVPAAAPAPAVTTAPPTPGAPATAAAAPGVATPSAGVVAIKDAKADSWTNNEGRTIQATLLEAGPDKVVFLMANGNKIDYPVANLNEESRKKLEALKAASAK